MNGNLGPFVTWSEVYSVIITHHDQHTLAHVEIIAWQVKPTSDGKYTVDPEQIPSGGVYSVKVSFPNATEAVNVTDITVHFCTEGKHAVVLIDCVEFSHQVKQTKVWT